MSSVVVPQLKIILLLYKRNLNNKCERLNCVSFHDKPFKIGQPPKSLSIIDSTVSTPSDSIANSLKHEEYNWRALEIDFMWIVSFGNGDVKISMKTK